MNVPTTFPFRECSEWLKQRANELASAGYQVEVIENEKMVPTICLKVSSASVLAELVVWEFARTSMQVVDLRIENSKIEDFDFELDAITYQEKLTSLFVRIRKNETTG
jgi:hypothetical protein